MNPIEKAAQDLIAECNEVGCQYACGLITSHEHNAAILSHLNHMTNEVYVELHRVGSEADVSANAEMVKLHKQINEHKEILKMG